MSNLVNAFEDSTWDHAERMYLRHVDDVLARGKDEDRTCQSHQPRSSAA